MLETLKHNAVGSRQGRPSQMHESVVPKTAIPTAAQAASVRSRSIAGQTPSRSEYVLTAVTTIIGKAETAQIRMKGWFKPKVAAAIARKGDGFTVTPMGGGVGERRGRRWATHDLASGDLIEVSGLTLEFPLT